MATTVIDRHVGARIRQARHDVGISQQALATALGITFQQIQKYEGGTNRCSAGRVIEIARATGLPYTYFFDGIPEGKNVETALSHDRGTLALVKRVRQIHTPALRRALLSVATQFVELDQYLRTTVDQAVEGTELEKGARANGHD